MPSLISRFRRSPSLSSDYNNPDDGFQPRDRPSSSPTIPRSPARIQSGSHFVESLTTPESPVRIVTPASASVPIAGTPKLVLTEEGASPRSFNSSSPHLDRASGLFGSSPEMPEFSVQQRRNSRSNLSIHTAPQPEQGLSAPTEPLSRVKTTETTRQRSSSIMSRLKGERSPTLSPTALPVDRRSNDKRLRRLSQSSGKVRNLAASIVGKGGEEVGNNRYSRSYANSEGSISEDESIGEDLEVTGFAVASNRRNLDFHALFPRVDEGDYLIEDYGCALSKDILVQGRLYVSENHICFHANIFGWVTDLVIPFNEIRVIERKNTALVIPNAIGISTKNDKYTFASFISRDTTFDVMSNIWRLCNPGAVMSTTSFQPPSRPASVNEVIPTTKGHVATQCGCKEHYSETALDTTLPSTPEKIYNLMTSSGWFKTWLVEDQKLKELEMSDWRPNDGSLLTRSMSYIKPLNGSIGPKQTKCHIVDEQDHFALDSYICLVTTTRTPDVPSGGVFSVKTRTCLSWAGSNASKMLVTTTVEWTGKSWVKGIIEKSAIDGQKQYHEDLVRGMRAHIKEHPSEFGRLEDEVCDNESIHRPTEAEAYAAEAKRKRQEDDLGYLQGGLDKVTSGFASIWSGLSVVFRATVDLLDIDPIKGKESVLFLVILVLVLSNIYTYISYARPDKVAQRQERRLLHNPLTEVQDLVALLDQVEARASRLRSAVTT